MPGSARGLTCYYELDPRLIVRRVGADWDRFAIENGAPELVSPHPLGRPLLMFLTDAVTVHLYELLFARVAKSRRPIAFPVRCDGAARRQYFNLTVAPAPDSGFSVTSLLVRSEPRPPVLLFDRTARRRDESLRVCSWCQRVEMHGRWREAEAALSELRLFERDVPPRVDPAACEDCQHFMLTMLRGDVRGP
jgi:hypothetical protein